MKVIGLTGGVGMGKSTGGELLRQHGIPVMDTDEIARQIVEPGEPALEEIRAVFGAEVIGPDGRLLRGLLAQRVFGDPLARERLEAILHPRIRTIWLAEVERLRREGAPACGVAIPLLFETQAASSLGFTVCLACSEATQQQRLVARGWTLAQIQERNRAQWPVEKKMALADYVIWTEGPLSVHAQQWHRILAHQSIEF